MLHYKLALSKQTRSVCILNRVKPSSTLLDEDSYKTDNEKLYRKYYSKKTRHLLTYFHSPQSLSKYPCKNIKHLRVYGSAFKRSPILSVKTLTLFYGVKFSFRPSEFDPTLHSMMSTFIDQISGFKFLEALTFCGGPREISLYQLRKLPHLRSLSLTLMKHQLVANTEVLQRLRLLDNFSLYVRNPNVNVGKDFLEEIVEFIVRLMSSKTFKSMMLDLSAISFSNNLQALDTLLGSLNTIKSTAFNIHLSLAYGSTIDAGKLQAALSHLDLLILRSQTGHIIGVNSCDLIKNKFSSPDQAQRKLDLILPLYKNVVDLDKVSPVELTKASESLNALFWKTLGIPFLIDALSVQNLISLAFPMQKAYMDRYTEICIALAEVLKNSPGLRHLTLESYESYCIDLDDNKDSKEINKVFDQIPCLHELESLVIKNLLFPSVSISTIGKLLAPLSNLKTLELSLDIEMQTQDLNIFLSFDTLVNLQTLALAFNIQEYSEPVDLFLSFERLAKLMHLHISLPELTTKAKINFIASLEKLGSLETLSIIRGSQILKESIIRSALFKILSDNKKLKQFTLTTFMNPGDLQKADGEENRKLALDMKDEIDNIFSQNVNIERWHMFESGTLAIDLTR